MLPQVCAFTYPLQFSAVRLHRPHTSGSLEAYGMLLVDRQDLALILGEYLDRDHRFFLCWSHPWQIYAHIAGFRTVGCPWSKTNAFSYMIRRRGEASCRLSIIFWLEWLSSTGAFMTTNEYNLHDFLVFVISICKVLIVGYEERQIYWVLA